MHHARGHAGVESVSWDFMPYAPGMTRPPLGPPGPDNLRKGRDEDKLGFFVNLQDSGFTQYRPLSGPYVHLRYREQPNYSLNAAMFDMYRTVHLSQVVVLMVADEPSQELLLSPDPRGNRMQRRWLELGSALEVERLTKQSPLDMIFAFSVGGGLVGVVALGNKLLTLFDRVQDSRRKKSDADVAVRANQIILAELNRGARNISQERLDQLGLGPSTPRIGVAAGALEGLDSIAVIQKLPSAASEADE